MKHTFLLMLVLLLTPVAAAGTPEDPEVTDAVEDCQFPAGNEYADIVSAWVSDEAATAFNVNLALNRWQEAVSESTGYTVQFTHQGVQFGVTAAYNTFQGWFYGNAVVDENGVSNYHDSTGSFTPGEPAVITVAFQKGHFPHTDATDNQLVDFTAATADLKTWTPFFIVDEDPSAVPVVPCDSATGDGVYTFQVGDHSNHGAGGTAEDTEDTEPEAPEAETDAPAEEGPPAPVDNGNPETAETPAPAWLVLVAIAAVAQGFRRGRR